MSDHDVYVGHVDVQGYAGSGTVVFSGYVKHGAGKRQVAVHVTPEDILNIARLLLVAGRDRDGHWQPGHAVYHRSGSGTTRPDVPVPCSSCTPDDESLAVAAAIAKLLGAR